MGQISGTWELLLSEYWRKSMIIGEKNTDLKRLTGRLKLRFLTEIEWFHWNQGEEVAHFAWFSEPWSIRRKPQTCRKSLRNFITYCCIKYTLSWTGFKLTTLVVIGTDAQVVVNPTTIRLRPLQPLFSWLCSYGSWIYMSTYVVCSQCLSSLKGLSWSWSCGSWICYYLCNQCLLHL
jgi:hypothetical protein